MTIYWHIHHHRLLEFLTEPIEDRIAYIKAEKPMYEVETRLRWMTPVQGGLPTGLVKAGAAYVKAWAAYDEAQAAYDEAQAAYDEAWAAYDEALAAYVKTRAAYVKAWAAYDEARDACDEARDAYLDAYRAALPALELLHAKEHQGCPWDGTMLRFEMTGKGPTESAPNG